MKTRFIILSMLLISLTALSSFSPRKAIKAPPYLQWSVNSAPGTHRTVSIFKIDSPTVNYVNVGPIAPGSSASGDFFYQGDYQLLSGYAAVGGARGAGNDIVEVYDGSNTLVYSQIIYGATARLNFSFSWLAYQDVLHIDIRPY